MLVIFTEYKELMDRMARPIQKCRCWQYSMNTRNEWNGRQAGLLCKYGKTFSFSMSHNHAMY